MITRLLEENVRSRLESRPAVVLMGPRQVGKTTLSFSISKNIPSIYLDLENNLDLQKVSDIHTFYQANQDKLIILDEVQRTPEIFAQIRGIIDQSRRTGRANGLFLFLGSASIDLLKQSSETLAGRISYMELHPISAIEYLSEAADITNLNQLWLRGGFPDSLLKKDDRSSLEWRYDFIRTYLERDIPQFGPRIPATRLARFWTMLAHNQGTSINASKLAANLEVSNVTISRYLDLLVDLLLLRKIQPYSSNIKKRLVKSPRIYIRDSGITHSLLNIQSFNDLLGHPVVGKSWEGFVIENIATFLPAGAHIYYYRTSNGAEIDLIIEFSLTDKWAIEIKRGSTFKLSKGFFEACTDIKPSKKFVVYSGPDSFPIKDDIIATPLFHLLEQLKQKGLPA